MTTADRLEKKRAYMAMRREDPEYRERCRAYMREYTTTPEGKDKQRQWRESNNPRVREHSRRKYNLRRGVDPGGYCEADVMSKTGGSCHWCGVLLSEQPSPFYVTVDHIVPISRGGEDTLDNVVPSCRHCNCSKYNKLVSEWSK